MFKIIASDLDGTLLNEEHEVDAATSLELHKQHEKGMRFIVATGRNYESVKEVFENFKFQFDMILLNGAQIRRIDGKVENIALNFDQVKAITDILKQYDLAWNAYTENGSATLFPKTLLNERFNEAAKSIGFITEDEFADLADELYANQKVYENLEELCRHEKNILKIEACDKDVEKLIQVKKALMQIEESAVVSSLPINVEVTHTAAQKGLSLRKLVSEAEIDENAVLVFGDSANDVSMLSLFENSYAMENAVDEAKAVARYVCDSNVNQGVLKTIQKVCK